MESSVINHKHMVKEYTYICMHMNTKYKKAQPQGPTKTNPPPPHVLKVSLLDTHPTLIDHLVELCREEEEERQ